MLLKIVLPANVPTAGPCPKTNHAGGEYELNALKEKYNRLVSMVENSHIGAGSAMKRSIEEFN